MFIARAAGFTLNGCELGLERVHAAHVRRRLAEDEVVDGFLGDFLDGEVTARIRGALQFSEAIGFLVKDFELRIQCATSGRWWRFVHLLTMGAACIQHPIAQMLCDCRRGEQGFHLGFFGLLFHGMYWIER